MRIKGFSLGSFILLAISGGPLVPLVPSQSLVRKMYHFLRLRSTLRAAARLAIVAGKILASLVGKSE